MKEGLGHKFDLKSLERTRLQLSDIHEWASTPSRLRDQNSELCLMIDNLCRVANMYNTVIAEYIENGTIATWAPQDYIDSKISVPIAIYKRLKNEQSK